MTDAEWLKGIKIEFYEVPEPQRDTLYLGHVETDGSMIKVSRLGFHNMLEANLVMRRRAMDAEDRLEWAERWRPAALLFAFAFVVAFVLVVTR